MLKVKSIFAQIVYNRCTNRAKGFKLNSRTQYLEVKIKMNKSAIFKSTLISAMLVVMVIALVPAVSATIRSDSKTITGSHGEAAGAGVQGDEIGAYYYSSTFHAGVWGIGGGVTFDHLQWWFYGSGSQVETGTTTLTTHDLPNAGTYTSLGATATGFFKWQGGSVYGITTSQAYLP